MQYLIFANRALAAEALQRINTEGRKRNGPHFQWANVCEHPIDLRCALAYDPGTCRGLDLADLSGEIVEEADASHRGFYFGPLEGRFCRPLHKCQDASILAENLARAYGHTPFPVTRSLFHAAFSSLYSVRSHIKKTMQGPAAKALPHADEIARWWADREREMNQEGELLRFLHELNNSEKHGTPSVPVGLQPKGVYLLTEKDAVMEFTGSQYMGNAIGLRLSAEGAFTTTPFGAGYEKWEALPHPAQALKDFGIKHVNFTFSILGLPKIHLGQALKTAEPVEITRLAVDYYFDLVNGAIDAWNSPT
jgi:hypothetical protein